VRQITRDAAVTKVGVENVFVWLKKLPVVESDKLTDHVDRRIGDAVRNDGFVAGLHKHYKVKENKRNGLAPNEAPFRKL
jgi:hypothetical protein